ncbi:MAG: hypothetical protein O7H40_17550, partial [Gammaproteobacteria bacterium]|nr:hypothetical protein [Gammaproteobacteria bacterium]
MKYVRKILLILIAAGLAVLPAFPALARVVVVNPAALEHAIGIQEIHTPDLMAMEGVVGTAVGVAGDGTPVIKVFTESRDVTGVPRLLDGIPVVIRTTGKIYALHHQPWHSGGPGGDDGESAPAGCSPTTWCERPVPIGVSTGHPAITAGTIGARVTDGDNVYALSNNHIYANENMAPIHDNVLQPGPFDGGVDHPDDTIGTLSDFETIVFSTSAYNVIDAAIALSSIANLGNATLSDGYGTPKS